MSICSLVCSEGERGWESSPSHTAGLIGAPCKLGSFNKHLLSAYCMPDSRNSYLRISTDSYVQDLRFHLENERVGLLHSSFLLPHLLST